jgi:predicted O-linked N-acetylglucosamine transferase (SPINDLY family)
MSGRQQMQAVDAAHDMAQAVALWRAGRAQEARIMCGSLAASGEPAALDLLAEICSASGALGEAIEHLQRLSHLRPRDAALRRRLGNAQLASGSAVEAMVSFRSAIAIEPRNVRGHNNLGQALMRLGRYAQARACFERALGIDASYAVAHNNLGNVAFEQGDTKSALTSFERALESDPNFTEALHNRGNALLKLDRPEEALEMYERALAQKPDSVATLLGRANTLQRLKRYELALSAYEAVLRCVSDHAVALSNRAGTLLALKRPEEALSGARRAIELDPSAAESHSNLGGALRALHQYEAAGAACEEALRLKPDFAEAWSNLANVMLALKRNAEAIAHCERAIALRPGLADAHDRRAWALLEDKRPDEAAQGYARLLELDPKREYAAGAVLGAQLAACDWSQYEVMRGRLSAAVMCGQREVSPFTFLTCSESAEAHLHCARTFAESEIPAVCRRPWGGQRYGHGKIRVAYLSADYHYHATAMLAAGLFEAHDRERFEINAVSFGPHDTGPVRQRLVRAFDRFLDVQRISDDQVADLLRSMEIDIAVDLKGHTLDGRAGIFARRAAPIQVSYLGYPGTLGLPEMDYLLADKIVVPPDQVDHYSERVVYLPDSYQVNDDKRAIAERVPAREEQGLPAEAFVFCCFNNNYKITPTVFDVWTRLLQRLPGSVLWLLQGNPVAMRNLRREASQRGVDAERLVFADRLPVEEHLARHQLADLFLDTLPYNAHTTSSDALWGGLPILTCVGTTFAGRVAASLLHAVGLPELVTATLAEYENRAFELATDRAQLAALRQRLAGNRRTRPLFDTQRFCRHLETAYRMMWDRYQQGLAPQSLTVPPLP